MNVSTISEQSRFSRIAFESSCVPRNPATAVPTDMATTVDVFMIGIGVRARGLKQGLGGAEQARNR